MVRATVSTICFSSAPSGVSLPPGASELAAPIRQILAEVDARTPSFCRSLPRLRATASGIRVSVRPVESDNTQALFERGELDRALATSETDPQDFHFRQLFDEIYVCTLQRDRPDAGDSPIVLDRIYALEHALVSFSRERFRGMTDDALAAVGRERRVVLGYELYRAGLTAENSGSHRRRAPPASCRAVRHQ